MKKLAFAIAAIAVLVPAAIGTSVFADSPGQLATGSPLFQVENLTQKTGYSSSVAATCNDVLQYKIEFSNTQFGAINNITVKVPFTGTTSVTGTNSAGTTVTSTGNLTATVDKGTLTYVAGSAQLFSEDDKLIKNLDSTVTTTGYNVGSLAGSATEFVYVQATVDCPTIVTPPPTTPPTTTTPPELPHTGPAATSVAGFIGLGAIVAAAVYFVNSRRALNRK